MKSPNGKALSIYKKHLNYFGVNRDEVEEEKAKQAALITAEEIINELENLPRIPYNQRREEFWKEVKSEIEKI